MVKSKRCTIARRDVDDFDGRQVERSSRAKERGKRRESIHNQAIPVKLSIAGRQKTPNGSNGQDRYDQKIAWVCEALIFGTCANAHRP